MSATSAGRATVAGNTGLRVEQAGDGTGSIDRCDCVDTDSRPTTGLSHTENDAPFPEVTRRPLRSARCVPGKAVLTDWLDAPRRPLNRMALCIPP